MNENAGAVSICVNLQTAVGIESGRSYSVNFHTNSNGKLS